MIPKGYKRLDSFFTKRPDDLVIQSGWYYSYDAGGITGIIPEIAPVEKEQIGKTVKECGWAWEYFLTPKVFPGAPLLRDNEKLAAFITGVSEFQPWMVERLLQRRKDQEAGRPLVYKSCRSSHCGVSHEYLGFCNACAHDKVPA